MYLEPTTVYYDGTEQRTRRAQFLLLLQPDDERASGNNLRAVARQVALHQCGQYMMGRANIGGRWFVTSGAYGSDGLPMTVPREVWKRGVPLPDELYQAWNKGGGWNGPGSEADALREWAWEHVVGK